jgi:hypothetical protein
MAASNIAMDLRMSLSESAFASLHMGSHSAPFTVVAVIVWIGNASVGLTAGWEEEVGELGGWTSRFVWEDSCLRHPPATPKAQASKLASCEKHSWHELKTEKANSEAFAGQIRIGMMM